MWQFRFSFNWTRLFIFIALTATAPVQAQTLNAPRLDAIAYETNYVFLQWTNSDGYSGYRVERKSGGADWSNIAGLGEANSYIDRDVIAGVNYTYRIQAASSPSLWTPSNEASITTPGPTLLPPSAAPTLYADAVSHTEILVRWTDVEGETQYVIERFNQSNQWDVIQSVGGNSGQYLDAELTPITVYGYRIRAWNPAGFSPYSNEAAATTWADPNVVPAIPRIVSSAQTDTSIELQWEYIKEASGYRVETKTGAANWTELTNIAGAASISLKHEHLTPFTEYMYRLRAYNGAGISEYSDEFTVVTYAPPPLTPQLQGVPLSYNSIDLRWTDVLTNCCTGPGYLGYRIESLSGTNWYQIQFAGVDDTNYIVRGLEPATAYTFRIVALNPLTSEWRTNSVTTMDPPAIPPQNAPIFYADRESSTTVELKWIDVELETEYRIERINAAREWEEIAIVSANTTSYLDTGLQPATPYSYRIRAANSFGMSPYSHPAATFTRAPAEVPILHAGAVSPTEVSLLAEPAEGGTLYRLERLTHDTWQVLFETNSALFRFEDSGLQPFTPYTYRLGSQNAAGAWFYSAGVNAQTWPTALTVSGRALSATEVELSWPEMPFAEYFYILKMTNGVWQTMAVEGNATSFIDKNLTASSTYTYRVYASNRFGRSPEAQVNVTTLGSISGDIRFTSITPSENGMTLRLTGSTGQKFKVQSTTDFDLWTDATDSLTLSADMQIDLPATSSATFYRTVRAE